MPKGVKVEWLFDYKGNKLPEKIISNAIGGYYSRLPQCSEKDFILSTVVHEKYDKQISH